VRYLYDADATIDILTNQPRARTRFETCIVDGVGFSVITLIELYTGVYGSTDPQRARGELEAVLQAAEIVPLDDRVVQRAAHLRADLLAMRAPIKQRAFDLVIAATALEHQLTLVTSNARDYADVLGLTLLDPRLP
jgi:tRNA(fMet)-specific endonuclease VapC